MFFDFVSVQLSPIILRPNKSKHKKREKKPRKGKIYFNESIDCIDFLKKYLIYSIKNQLNRIESI